MGGFGCSGRQRFGARAEANLRFAQLEDVAGLEPLLVLDRAAVEPRAPGTAGIDEDDAIVGDLKLAVHARGPRVGQLHVAVLAAAQDRRFSRRKLDRPPFFRPVTESPAEKPCPPRL